MIMAVAKNLTNGLNPLPVAPLDEANANIVKKKHTDHRTKIVSTTIRP